MRSGNVQIDASLQMGMSLSAIISSSNCGLVFRFFYALVQCDEQYGFRVCVRNYLN